MSRRKFNERPKLHIKKGDEVRVLSGRERGKSGRVQKIQHKRDKGARRTAMAERALTDLATWTSAERNRMGTAP